MLWFRTRSQTLSVSRLWLIEHLPTTRRPVIASLLQAKELQKRYQPQQRRESHARHRSLVLTSTWRKDSRDLTRDTHPSLHRAMSSKLIPSNPSEVMVIRNITPKVVTLSVPFTRAGVLHIGGRGTIVKLTSGDLAVFSPVAFTPEVGAKLKELGGTIKYIIALDFEHHIFISEWTKEFPEAKIIGPEGLPEKRAKANDEKIGKEAFFAVFTAKTKREQTISPEFDADFEYEYVETHPNKELVFFYKPDKVLIEADLMFNLPAREQYSKVPGHNSEKPGIMGKLFSSLQSTEGDAKGLKRFLWYAISRSNRPVFNESIQRIDEWDFDILIPCHGDTIEQNAKATFRKVFEWHLTGKK